MLTLGHGPKPQISNLTLTSDVLKMRAGSGHQGLNATANTRDTRNGREPSEGTGQGLGSRVPAELRGTHRLSKDSMLQNALQHNTAR